MFINQLPQLFPSVAMPLARYLAQPAVVSIEPTCIVRTRRTNLTSTGTIPIRFDT